MMWAAVGMAFYSGTNDLNTALTSMGQSATVYSISTGILGVAGGVMAIIGVVVYPITSGDTAFRSARLMLAEWLKMDQKQTASDDPADYRQRDYDSGKLQYAVALQCLFESAHCGSGTLEHCCLADQKEEETRVSCCLSSGSIHDSSLFYLYTGSR